MGNGVIDDITDVIYVEPSKFNTMQTEKMAVEIDNINDKMLKEGRHYVLIGPGRWGTRDKFIGIPVVWPQISNAKVIVEISLPNFHLDASLGSHFFHNVTSMGVGYFSIHSDGKNFIQYDLLQQQTIVEEGRYFKHVIFENDLDIVMDGKKRQSLIRMGDDSNCQENE